MHDLAHQLDLLGDAVLTGQFDDLSSLAREIEGLLRQVAGLSAAEAAMIRAKASRNVTVLGAAMQGVRAAQRRLSDLREASTGHRTYGPAGQRSAIAAAPATIRQRV
jgi:ElaB/YqjD/DUF883 family membrane-anchored ribosome-binding protein